MFSGNKSLINQVATATIQVGYYFSLSQIPR